MFLEHREKVAITSSTLLYDFPQAFICWHQLFILDIPKDIPILIDTTKACTYEPGIIIILNDNSANQGLQKTSPDQVLHIHDKMIFHDK